MTNKFYNDLTIIINSIQVTRTTTYITGITPEGRRCIDATTSSGAKRKN